MKPVAFLALFLIANFAAPAPTWAQKVYKCGNSYSDAPCPKGQPGEEVDVADPRTPAQKSAADAQTRQIGRSADEMERRRLREETQWRAANRPARGASAPRVVPPPADGSPPKVLRRKARKREPEYFTAIAPKPPASKPARRKP